MCKSAEQKMISCSNYSLSLSLSRTSLYNSLSTQPLTRIASTILSIQGQSIQEGRKAKRTIHRIKLLALRTSIFISIGFIWTSKIICTELNKLNWTKTNSIKALLSFEIYCTVVQCIGYIVGWVAFLAWT